MVVRLNIMTNLAGNHSPAIKGDAIEGETNDKAPNLSLVKPLISLVIPTMLRPEGLHKAMHSAAAQIIKGHDIEIIIADNSPDSSARAQVEAFKKTTDIPVKYISEPKAGVANVRNAALTLVSGQYIAFLDDDQEATSDWLAHMVSQCRSDSTSAVFAKIEGRTSADVKNARLKLRFFSRDRDGAPSGVTDKFDGCGASLLNLSKIDAQLLHFDPRRNQTGGEDDALFSAIQNAGGTFSWSKEALVYEDVPERRITKRYICQRSFAFGQGPSRICLEKNNFSPIGLMRWMTIGVAQMIVFLPLAAITLPFENAFHMKCLRKGCEGAGKVFWQKPFRQKLYGDAALARLT